MCSYSLFYVDRGSDVGSLSCETDDLVDANHMDRISRFECVYLPRSAVKGALSRKTHPKQAVCAQTPILQVADSKGRNAHAPPYGDKPIRASYRAKYRAKCRAEHCEPVGAEDRSGRAGGKRAIRGRWCDRRLNLALRYVQRQTERVARLQ